MSTSDIRRLVLDANIMVSALLGRSFPILLQLFERDVSLFAPVQQLAETRNVLHQRFSLPSEWIDAQMVRLLAIIQPLHPALLDKHEVKARSRLHHRGQPDWPVLAASMETGAGVWSHDKDFFGSGAPVWSTRVLMRQLELDLSLSE